MSYALTRSHISAAYHDTLVGVKAVHTDPFRAQWSLFKTRRRVWKEGTKYIILRKFCSRQEQNQSHCSRIPVQRVGISAEGRTIKNLPFTNLLRASVNFRNYPPELRGIPSVGQTWN